MESFGGSLLHYEPSRRYVSSFLRPTPGEDRQIAGPLSEVGGSGND